MNSIFSKLKTLDYWTRDVLRLSKKEGFFWVIASVLTSLVIMQLPNKQVSGIFGEFFYATNMSATILILGLPFSLGAGYLFATDSSRKYLLRARSNRGSVVGIYILRLAVLYCVTFIFMTSMVIVSYIAASKMYSGLSSISILLYIQITIASLIIISWVLVSISTFMTLLVDDWKLSTFLVSAITGLSATVFGMTPWQLLYKDFSLFGIYHNFRFFAILLSGHSFPTDSAMTATVGLSVTLMDMILPTSVLLVISCILFAASFPLFKKAINLWKLEHTNPFNEIRQQESKTRFDMGKIPYKNTSRLFDELRKALLHRRQSAVVSVLLLWIIFPITVQQVISPEGSEEPEIIYKTPEEGITMMLGQWSYGEVEIPQPPSGKQYSYTMAATILEWGNCTAPLEAELGLVHMSREEFEDLEDDAKSEAMNWHTSGINEEHPDAGSGYFTLGEEYGDFTWALRYYKPIMNMTGCSLKAYFEIKLVLDDYEE